MYKIEELARRGALASVAACVVVVLGGAGVAAADDQGVEIPLLVQQNAIAVEGVEHGTAVHSPAEPAIEIPDVPVQVPVTVCGNAVSVLGDAGVGCEG
ncbi:MAG: chaplin [Saccharothrix sp.]|nr:chaplin [Saccharothrix sp.]